MKINSENIEALIVDYFDGALNVLQSLELEHAIAQNAAFRQLFDEYRSAIDAEIEKNASMTIDPEFAEKLKHTSDFDDMSTPYFDRLAVLVTEGIATKSERDEYCRLVLNNDVNLSSAVLYSNCKIQDNKDLQCPYKQTLKRSRIRPLWYALAAAAAVSAFFFMARVFYAPQFDIKSSQMSGVIALEFNSCEVSEPQLTDTPNIIITAQSTSQQSTSRQIKYQPTNQSLANSEKTDIALSAHQVLKQEDTIDFEICLANIHQSVISYSEETLQPIFVDRSSIDQSDNYRPHVSVDFIGEQGFAELKEETISLRRRFKERQNPKICFSHDENGRKDGVSLLIGNRELRVWSR